MALKQQPDQRSVQQTLLHPSWPEHGEQHDQQGDHTVCPRHDGAVVAESEAEKHHCLERKREGGLPEQHSGRDPHKHHADNAEIPVGQPQLRKRPDDQIPQAGMPLDAQIGKQLPQRGVLRNRPCLCLVAKSLVV